MKDPIPEDVLKRFAARKGQSWTAAFFYLMKELNLSAEELISMPIPRINVLLVELKDHRKREEEQSKNMNKGRR